MEEALRVAGIAEFVRLLLQAARRRAHAATILHGNKSTPGKLCRARIRRCRLQAA